MSTETLITVEGVSKKFCRNLKKSLWYGMKDLGSEILGRSHDGKSKLRPDEFWAVKDVSFELKRGECLGLIGHNGAGKSTLLKMLNGLIKPDQGKITIKGRIGALIELNAGFNPILTGRENVYTYGSILGLTKKEIDDKYITIVEFAELSDFMDMPIQSYSSGMKVRLGFAVAAQMEPDILLIDEVLAVGDVGFKIKCYNEIYRFKKNAAVIFVSHSMSQISKVCNKGILLKDGKIWIMKESVAEVIDGYYAAVNCSEPLLHTGDGRAELLAITMIGKEEGRSLDIETSPERANSAHRIQIEYGKPVSIEIVLRIHSSITWFSVMHEFVDVEKKLVAQCFSENKFEAFKNTLGCFKIRATIDNFTLNQGRYTINTIIREIDLEHGYASVLGFYQQVLEFQVTNDALLGSASVQYMGHWEAFNYAKLSIRK